ncbi:MAG TPA: EI24 domain-containing protein [Spirochaetota bacterium]|nr:EI24 domain-containing protein [Spirochaetota bacterium]
MTKRVSRTALLSAPKSFAEGVFSPFRALSTVNRVPGLKRFFVIPFIINIALLAGAFILGYHLIGGALHGLLPQGDAWYLAVLRWLIAPLLAVFLSIAVIFIYSITGSVVTAPFNDIISAKVERALLGGSPDDRFTLAGLVDDVLRALFNALKLIGLLVLFQVLILAVNLVPVAGGPIYAVLSFTSAMFFLGFQFFDFPLERRRFYFKDKLRAVWGHKFTAIGIGTGLFLISFVPLVGFLGLNLAAVGATEIFVRRMLPGLDDL